MTSIGDTVSRLRGIIKADNEDAFITDRFLYSVLLKYARTLIRRQDNENKIMKFQSLFEPLPCVELIEVDKVDACCIGIKSNCIIKRTKDRLPTVLEGAYGPILRTVSSIDGSIQCYKTYPGTYTSMVNTTTFKYNKNKYYWYLDGYLYFPNIEWEAAYVEGLWDESISYLKCDGDECMKRQDEPTHIPDYLFSEIEQNAKNDLLFLIQAPTETTDDKMSQIRA